jgi:hypothetical protein
MGIAGRPAGSVLPEIAMQIARHVRGKGAIMFLFR